MSRRRSKNPTKAISITLPQSLLDEIDDHLTRTQSRSAWIAKACKAAMENDAPTISEMTTKQLMAVLHTRSENDEGLRAILLDRLTSNPSSKP